ncbi:MAG: ADOP family duplicated permease [Bryobacteraceae bacterium]|jgi:predicted permease
MPLWSRIVNMFRGESLSREIDEEFETHIQEALAQGRDPAEARQAFGSVLRQRERSRDMRVVPWLDSLRADAVFGWRQLMKRKATSAAAILSLALAMGACTAAFRLIDAVMLRPLPVANPERLYAVSRQEFRLAADGKAHIYDGWAYPAFRLMRAAAKDQAELIAISGTGPTDLTYKSDRETEKANVQYVSGWMFGSFGLRPALGRLLTENDDREPGAHPYAVLSEDYWARRFGKDPKAIRQTFRLGNRLFEIVGVCAGPFTGTQTGFVTDIFVPTMMNPAVGRSDSTWHETWARLKPGVAVEPVRARLDAASRAFEAERAKGFAGMSKKSIDEWLKQRVVLQPAGAGFSSVQKYYRQPLVALGVLVALVLMIACANVANLMTAQAASRAREMALRVSIGAGRWRLVQLVLMEGAWIGFLAAAAGALFAWWSAPFVVRMLNPLGDPLRLSLPADWRVLGFGLALTTGVTLLFGLAPALRASTVKPASALKGGEDPHSRRRLMHALVALQAAFCFLVLYAAGLLVATFERLSREPTGFSAERLLTLNTVAERPQPPVYWDQVVEHLRTVPGVESVALASRALLSGYSSNDAVAVDGGPPSEDMAYFLTVSPGFLEAMKIPLVDGRDFRAGDTYPGVAIVSETFARRFFKGENPVGRWFERASDEGPRFRLQVTGLVRDAHYMDLRGPMLPVAYIPFRQVNAKGALQPVRRATVVVRTSGANPRALAPVLSREVANARPEFRVTNIETQAEIDLVYTVRERLLALLGSFFAVVAVMLAGVGLYGVLDYSVLQRRREIGIRMAIGAQGAAIARLVTTPVFAMVLAGGLVGLALGMASMRYIESLFYEVKATDLGAMALPSLTILAAAMMAAAPAVVRAVRIDPAAMLRPE